MYNKDINDEVIVFSPFLITEFKTGLFSYLQPWISPRDSFSQSENVYINRGCVFSREGLELIGRRFTSQVAKSNGLQHTLTLPKIFKHTIEVEGNHFKYKQDSSGVFKKVSGSENVGITFSSSSNTLTLTFQTQGDRDFVVSYSSIGPPLRAIIPFADQESQGYGHILADDEGICVFFNGQRLPRVSVDQLAFLFKAKQRSFSFHIPWEFDPQSLKVTFSIGGNVLVFPYNNGFKPQGDVQTLTYNQGTRVVSGTLSKDPKDGDLARVSLFPLKVLKGAGGLISWDSSRNFIVISNGSDRILLFNIADKTLSRPFFPITEEALWKGQNQIKSAKFVKFFKNRLLLLDTEIENAGGQNGRWKQSVRWSTPFLDQNSLYSHWNFVSDKNYGGEYSPDTNATVVGCGPVRDKMVVWYTEDVYAMEPTGVSQSAFVFNKINSSKFATCPFSVTDLDTTTQIFGSRGYLQSDGVSVSRMDLAIPDYYEKIDFLRRDRISSFRFSGEDNRICTLYPSYSSPNGECDRMLVYNFVEDTFSEYAWEAPKISCLGAIRAEKITTWGEMKNYKFRPDIAWFSFSWFATRISERIPVAGGMQGEVYALRGETDWDSDLETDLPIPWSFKTCRFAPFIEQGAQSLFGYIDLYFEGFGSPTAIILDVFADGHIDPTKSIDCFLEAPAKTQTFRRIHLQVTGQFIEIRLRSNPSLNYRNRLKLLGLILWAEPAGDIRDIRALI